MLSAAELYTSEHDDCPTLADLSRLKIIDPQRHVHDAWGTEFWIDCSVDLAGIVVISAGPDRRFNTRDDLRFGDRGCGMTPRLCR